MCDGRGPRRETDVTDRGVEMCEGAASRGKVAVVGTGALGQMVAHELVRLGYKELILIDKDVFTPGNKNRQLYAKDHVMGQSKAAVTAQELLKINARDKEIESRLHIEVYQEFLDESNGLSLMSDARILVDCTDNTRSKLYLERLAQERGIPLVHGGVEGWCGQVAVVLPGERILEKIYQDKEVHPKKTYAPTVNVVASLQAAEVCKLAMGKAMRGQVLWVDLMNQEFSTLRIT